MNKAFLAALAAALFLASCASAPPSQNEKPATAPKAAKQAALVAVFDFQLKSGDAAIYASLKSDVPEAISEAFVRGGVLRPLERSELEKAISEQELGVSGLVDEATAARVGRLAGARNALLGSVSILAGQARLSCRLIDVETAEIIYAESAYGDVAKVFEVADDLASKVEEAYSE